jgi:hypothetical protein
MKKNLLSVCFSAFILLLTVSTSWSGEDKNFDQHLDETIEFKKDLEETQTNYSVNDDNREAADEYRAESEPISHDEQSNTEVYESGEVYSEPDENYEYLDDSDDVQTDTKESKWNTEKTQGKEEDYPEYVDEPDEIQADPNEPEVKPENEDTGDADTGDVDTWNTEETNN